MAPVVIADLHDAVSWLFVVANGVVGLGPLAAHTVESLRGRAVWIGVGLAQAVIVVQVLLGVALQVERDISAGQHQAYGFAAFLSMTLIYAYRNEMRDRLYLLYGLGSLWLMGLGVRAMLLV